MINVPIMNSITLLLHVDFEFTKNYKIMCCWNNSVQFTINFNIFTF